MKSSHDFELILSREAYEDLVDIQNYTYAQYSEAQWSSYGALMEDALNLIVRHPVIRAKTFPMATSPGMQANM